MNTRQSDAAGPIAVFGMTLYNNSAFLEKALESLHNQTRDDFAVIMLDDCSNDETEEIARAFAQKDSRFVYVRNSSRSGMLGTWRKAFTSAQSHFPSMKYFAWASDHDMWEPEWLEKLSGVLDTNKEAVMAYPLAQRIDHNGDDIEHNVFKGVFSTANSRNLIERSKAVTKLRRNFGNMVYGLYRADALHKAGIYRDTLIPDRLLMQELSLAGKIMQVEEVLWKRRFRKQISLKSQLNSLWYSRRPWSSLLPWEFVHSFHFVKNTLKLSGKEARLSDKVRIILYQMEFVASNLIKRFVSPKRKSKKV